MTPPPFRLDGPMPEGTVVLEASAGTGKTFTLAHLFLRFVADEGLPIDRVLVVTFTNAAAAELRDRIRQRLVRADEALRMLETGALGAATDESARATFVGMAIDPVLEAWALGKRRAQSLALARARIRLALASFDQHRIGTIHSTCQRLLGRHAFESGADFEAELVADVAPLCREAAFDFLALRLAQSDPALEEPTGAMLTIDRLAELARTAIAWPRASILPEVPTKRLELDRDALTQAHRAMLDAWQRDRSAIRAVFAEAIAAGAVNGRPNLGRPAKWEGSFRTLDSLLASMPRLPRKLHDDVLRIAEIHGNELLKKGKQRDAFLARFDQGFFAAFERFREAVDAHRAMLEAAEIRLLHDYVAFARERIARQKAHSRTRTFDDVLRLLDDALAGPDGEALAQRIRTEFRAAMIDEFQDTDPVQWSIFRRVFHGQGRPLLLIGDPKQAIYGFRGADLGTYLRARGEADRCFSLGTNHRSDAALLDAIAALYTSATEPFGRPGADGGTVEFVEVAAAAAGSRLRLGGQAPKPIRLLLPPADDAQAEEAEAETDDSRDAREHPVARDVTTFLASDARIVVEGGDRPIRPSDCAILVRDRFIARTLQRDLRRLGVPAVIRSDRSVYDTDEARELQLVLDAALHPADRRALASALATDLVGSTLADLAALETDEAVLDARYEAFRGLGEVLRERGFAAFARSLIGAFDVHRRWLASTDGERRVANLGQLIELLHSAAEREHLGPESIRARLAKLRTEGLADDERKIRLESDSDAVEIVTMHVAKGLEWGVVWCVSLGAAPSIRETAAAVIRDAEGSTRLHLGPAARIRQDAAVEARLLESQRLEELRLAYVAITRAKHLLNVYVPTQVADDPFAALFLEGRSRTIRIGGEGEGGDVHQVPDMRAAAALVEQLLGDHVRVARSADFPLRSSASAEAVPEGFAVRRFERTRPLDVHWRITSYTGLSAQSAADRERIRFDEENVASAALPSEDDTPWAEVAGGRELGVQVHEVLERTPAFTEPALLDALRSVRRPSPRAAGEPEAVSNEELARLLGRSLSTPLFDDDPFELGSADVSALLREARFSLPVAGGRASAPDARGLSARGLASVFRAFDRPTMPAAYAARAEQLALAPELRGFLVGAIDLVFEHRGHIYVADYKTTRLGASRADYAREVLPTAMMHHDYTLQALIYALAVHRHLLRRESGYDYEARFGGVLHLFLRAMDPSTGPTVGVYLDRPPLEQLRAFEQALDLGRSVA